MREQSKSEQQQKADWNAHPSDNIRVWLSKPVAWLFVLEGRAH
jgi:hypothetical protein